jgi:hypothetical protein
MSRFDWDRSFTEVGAYNRAMFSYLREAVDGRIQDSSSTRLHPFGETETVP